MNNMINHSYFLSWIRCKTQLIHVWVKYYISKNLFFFLCTGQFLHRETKDRVKSNIENKNSNSGKHWVLYLKKIQRQRNMTYAYDPLFFNDRKTVKLIIFLHFVFKFIPTLYQFYQNRFKWRRRWRLYIR